MHRHSRRGDAIGSGPGRSSRWRIVAAVLGPAAIALAAGPAARATSSFDRPASAPAVAPESPARPRGRTPERLWYMTSSEVSFESFRAHVDRIDVVAPQVYSVDSLGTVWGSVDPRVLALAREKQIRVIPLIVNPGFSQPTMHALLSRAASRRRVVDSLVALAVRDDYDGWQLDFENIAQEDRDSLSAFFRQAATALHAAGRTLSIAVVPALAEEAASGFAAGMQESWRGAYDVKALAEAGDFISLMTYAEHAASTTPGPIASLDWMRDALDEALSHGVPRAKLSLGIPVYSGHWYTRWQEGGGRVVGEEIGWQKANSLLQRTGAQPRWLEDAGASFAFWPVSGTWEWLFLEDARSFRAKLRLLDDYPGLRGFSVWVLGAEDPAVWQAVPR